jgi:hypothetical protein
MGSNPITPTPALPFTGRTGSSPVSGTTQHKGKITMDEINTPPAPPSPQPEKKDTVTFNKKNLAIGFLVISLIILIIAIAVPGDDKTSAPAVTAAPAPVVTNPPVTAPPVNKYDKYVNALQGFSGQANSWSRPKLIEFGDLVCETLDNGKSISSVVSLMENYAKTQSDVEFLAGVVMFSVQHICPEYMSDLNAYLGT